MNAYSSDFAQDIEALSSALSEMLSRLDNADVTGLAPSTVTRPSQYDYPVSYAGGKPGLPDPRLVRRIIRQRQQRGRFFPNDLFADPAWDMLLDLAAATAEHSRVPVTSLCHASGVPPTTALRWIGLLEKAGLVRKQQDSVDRRRAFVVLTDNGVASIARYFQAIRPGGVHLA